MPGTRRICRLSTVDRRLLLLAACVAFAAPAPADPLDAFGFGPRAAAMGTAGIAEGEAIEAARANPAAAASATGFAAALGWLVAVPQVDLDGGDAGLDAIHGAVFGAAVPFRWLGIDLGAALALHVPDRFLGRVALPGATEPRVLRWSDWSHRLSATAVLSAKIGGGFSLGVGLALLADASAQGRVSFGAREGTTWGAADVRLEMPLRVAPVAGLLFEPASFLAFGLVFRGALAMDVDIDLRADADFADESLTGEARTRLRGSAYYSPQALAFGVSARWNGWTIDADVSWLDWSGLALPFADVDTAIALGAPAPIVHLLVPHADWLDTAVPAVGVEYEFRPVPRHALAFRAGYAFEPSPVPPQTGLGNVADPDRHLISCGAGWRMDFPREDGSTSALEAGFAFQAHRLVPFRTEKDVPEFAGGPLSAGGWLWALQLWTGVRL